MFEVTSGPGEVNAWSEVRLPFQPKGEMLEFRQQLDSAIRAMPAAGAGHLVTTYTAADPDTLIDTENILFYNVGPGCFAAHTRGSLAFERVFAAPPDPPAPAGWTPRHHHRYRVTPPPRSSSIGVPCISRPSGATSRSVPGTLPIAKWCGLPWLT